MTAKYLLPCCCGQKLPIDAAQAGQRVRCRCGAELEVPTLLGLKALDRVESPDRGERPSQLWGAGQRLLLVGAIVVFAGLGLASWFFLTRPREGDVALFPPIVALDLWESLKMGVDRPMTRFERHFVAVLEHHHRWTIVGLVVAGIGALIVGGSLVLGRRGPGSP